MLCVDLPFFFTSPSLHHCSCVSLEVDTFTKLFANCRQSYYYERGYQQVDPRGELASFYILHLWISLSLSLSVTRRGHRFHDESTVKKISPSPPRDLFESRNDPLRLFLLPHRSERFHRRRSANYDRLLHRSSPQWRRISGNRWPSSSYVARMKREREEKKMTHSRNEYLFAADD